MNATKHALKELKTLAGQAADVLYRRIELAAQVLGDLDWIAAEHGGSDLKAQDALQMEFFRDLGGFISLGKLIAMFRHVAKAQWAEVRYDIAAVEVLYDEVAAEDAAAGGDRPKRTPWKAVAEERGEKIDQLTRQVEQSAELVGKLQAENAELRAKVARLEGRIEEMNRRVGRRELAGV